MEPSERVHPGIRKLRPYVPGRPIEEVMAAYGLERVVKLASNENPLGCSPRVRERLAAALSEVHRYPDGRCAALRAALAECTGLPPEALVFGNGSNELLELALRTFVRPGETVASAAVTFGVYRLLAQAHGARYVTAPMADLAYDLDALAEVVVRERARLVFVANPNNPTGTAFGAEAFARFMARIPEETLVVYDAAYAEYAVDAGIPDGLAFLERYENLFVTRTFSKAYGLAGLRIGWGALRPELADFVDRVRQPFNVNRLAQEAALAALADEAFLRRVVELNRRGIEQLRAGLAALGLESYPSFANFVLFRAPMPADELVERLLQEGVIVRSMRGFGLPEHVRVNTGTEEENAFFLAALARALEA